jgi:hypothetical protein
MVCVVTNTSFVYCAGPACCLGGFLVKLDIVYVVVRHVTDVSLVSEGLLVHTLFNDDMCIEEVALCLVM